MMTKDQITSPINGLKLAGLGFWNVYFIAKFILHAKGFITMAPLYNAILIAVLLLLPRLKDRLQRPTRWLCVLAAAGLIYSESWLPGIESLWTNAANIAGFSINYLVQLALDFINVSMILGFVLLVLVYELLKHYVRVSVITVTYFVVCILMPFGPGDSSFEEAAVPGVTTRAITTEAKADPAMIPQDATIANNETIQSWYTAFLEYEKERKAVLPNGILEKDTPFDIILLNICSMSNDDLEASGLENHKVFDQFDIRFDHFNTATSYSGPAALRLLNAACGQTSHEDLYGARRPDCEIMNRLDQLGFRQHVFMDHSGEYDNFLLTLQKEAGLNAPLEAQKHPVRYIAFNDEPIYDDLSVLRHWQRTTAKNGNKRSVSFINLIALHDGNRLPRHSRWQAFKPRAQILLNDLNKFMRELERTGRKVMLVVVPEHGAAVRGDKVQAPRLRDIPSLRITEVPVMVKFFGLKQLPKNQIHVTGTSSYLALSSLIGKTIASNFFSKPEGAVAVEDLIRDLPETNIVSENGQAIVLRYKGKDYIRMNDGPWKPYAH